MLVRDRWPFHYGLNVDGLIGVEVEMEANDLLPDPVDKWVMHGDGSLRGNYQGEYVLRTPATFGKCEASIKELYDRFEAEHSQINPSGRCGVHIHLNVQPWEEEKVFNFITVYLMLEELLVNWCGHDRSGNMFCLRASDAQELITSLVNDKEKGLFNATIEADANRYASINLEALPKYGSLEFRAMRTPYHPDKIVEWINYLRCIKSYSKRIEDMHEVLYECSAGGGIAFVQNVFKDRAKNLIHEHTAVLVERGVRSAQHIAFTPFGG